MNRNVLSHADLHDRPGAASAVLLHGWPGDRRDWDRVVPRIRGTLRVVVPDLRGFGSDADPAAKRPIENYAAKAQAERVLDLIHNLGAEPVVLAGYDIGSRVAMRVAEMRPDLIRGLVLSPPLPGAGERVLNPLAQSEFWYQTFHQLGISDSLIDGNREAVRKYLEHFWGKWSGPGFQLDPDHLEHLVDVYARPGAFRASISWYKAGAGTAAASLREVPPAPADRLNMPTTILWPSEDPLFPVEWSDRVDAWFSCAHVEPVQGAGHFVPLEASERVASAIIALA